MIPPTARPASARLAVARRFPLRAAAVIGLVLLAYNYSLMTLVRGLTLQTPLAYLALVPALALVLAIARLRLGLPETQIHDRQLDWIVGLALLAGASAILILAPQPATSEFWLGRMDLLTLPLYVAGLVSLLFGVRRVWALRFPILFLLLAWPIPFTWLLSVTAVPLTDFTAGAVALITQIIPVARQAGGDDGTLFLIGSGDNMFGVGIGSACSGVNSFIGFLLLGVATLYLVQGTALRRVAWLATGLLLIIALNLARIMAILVVGNAFGQEAALDILHPIAGLVVFNIGVLVMLVLAPAFGLRYANGSSRAHESGEHGRPAPVRRVSAALLVAMGVAAILGVTNAAYARYESISSGLADARLARIDIETAHVPGWDVSFVGNVGQARQYFGDTATWERVAYRPTSQAEITSDRTVYIDVLTTDDAGTFAAYGLEACYTFHGFEISSVAQVDIGAGVQAEVIDYTNVKNGIEWSALWWEWPYTAESGETRYQRIVVYISDGPNATLTAFSDIDIPTQDPRFIETDRFLASLGRSIVDSQLAAAEGDGEAASVLNN